MEREADAGRLFEPTSPLARELAASGPHVDPIAAARDLLERMDEGEKVETLNAHPRLGERRERISPDSRAEQSGLGPTRSRELERVNEW